MKLEKSVCNLSQAKRLKELGVMQVSHFRHDDYGNVLFNGNNNTHLIGATSFAAFTVAELGVMMPTGYDTMFIHTPKNGIMCVGYDHNSMPYPNEDSYFETEAECRAAILISLLERKEENVNLINTKLITH